MSCRGEAKRSRVDVSTLSSFLRKLPRGLRCGQICMGIADELRKFRIAYEMAEDSKARAAKPAPPRADDESRFMPQSS